MAAIVGVCRDDISIGSKGTRFLLILAVVVLSLSLTHHVGVEGARSTLPEEEDLELERQLKILNKPPVKTIHTEWGEIYDCIDIHKQPAFDHPLLKNHKIQMKPSSVPSSVRDETSFTTSKSKKLSTRRRVEGCPEGTVPIRRTSKEDLIRAKSLRPNEYVPNEIRAELIYEEIGETFYGAKGDIVVYNPKIAQDQYSSAEIGLISGPDDKYAGIRFGWLVNPQLHGDNFTRSFAYWTADAGRTTGCYNTLCPGFVQVDKSLVPGSPLSNISVYDGVQFILQDYVFQAQDTKDWWLQYEGINVGYFPNSLFPLISAGATYIHWGGRAKPGSDEVAPELGNGLFPDNYYRHSCFIANMQYVNKESVLLNPKEGNMVKRVGCYLYELEYNGYRKDIGHVVLFGGPGGAKC